MSFRLWIMNLLTGSRQKALIYEGRRLLDKNRYIAAQDIYRQVIESWPNDPEGYLGMARVYDLMGLRPEAARERVIGESLATLDEHPDNVKARLELSRALSEKNMHGWAAAHAQHALRHAPHRMEVLEVAAKAFAANRNYDKAAAVLEEMLRQEPLDALLYKKLAFAYQNAHQTADAVRASGMAKALEAVSGDPGNVVVVEQAVQQLVAAGRRRLALDLVERSLKGNPGKGGLYRLQGELLLAERDSKDAMLALRKAVDMEPTDQKAHRLLAQAYAGEGQQQKAHKHDVMADTIQKARQGGDAMATEVAMVRLLIDNGQIGAAENKAYELARTWPEDWRGPFCLAMVFKAQGKVKESMQQFMKAKVMNANAPEVHIELARMQSDMGEAMEAIGEARLAVKLSPRDLEFRRVLAHILRTHNFMDQAIEEEDIADSLDKKTKNGRMG